MGSPWRWVRLSERYVTEVCAAYEAPDPTWWRVEPGQLFPRVGATVDPGSTSAEVDGYLVESATIRWRSHGPMGATGRRTYVRVVTRRTLLVRGSA